VFGYVGTGLLVFQLPRDLLANHRTLPATTGTHPRFVGQRMFNSFHGQALRKLKSLAPGTPLLGRWIRVGFLRSFFIFSDCQLSGTCDLARLLSRVPGLAFEEQLLVSRRNEPLATGSKQRLFQQSDLLLEDLQLFEHTRYGRLTLGVDLPEVSHFSPQLFVLLSKRVHLIRQRLLPSPLPERPFHRDWLSSFLFVRQGSLRSSRGDFLWCFPAPPRAAFHTR